MHAESVHMDDKEDVRSHKTTVIALHVYKNFLGRPAGVAFVG